VVHGDTLAITGEFSKLAVQCHVGKSACLLRNPKVVLYASVRASFLLLVAPSCCPDWDHDGQRLQTVSGNWRFLM
jgi:hypothetical protein